METIDKVFIRAFRTYLSMYHVYIWVEVNELPLLLLLLFWLFKVTWKTHRRHCQYVGDILNDPDKRKCALSAMILNNLHKIWRNLWYQTQIYAEIERDIQFNQRFACVT